MRIFATLLVLFCFPSFGNAKDLRDAWNDILKKCATNNTMGKKGIFFGVSNSVGPGSVWRKTDDDGYGLRFELSDAIPNLEDRKKLVKENDPVACPGNTSSSWGLKGQMPFTSRLSALSGDISAGFSHAKNVVVTIESFEWDEIKELEYEFAFNRLGPESPYKRDASADNRWIIGKALLIKGFAAEMDFNSEVGAALKRKLESDAAKAAPPGKDQPAVDQPIVGFNWTGTTHLKITATEPFYIWGAKRKMVGNGFGMGGGAPQFKVAADESSVKHPNSVADQRPAKK
jgi:hypothetical protein